MTAAKSHPGSVGDCQAMSALAAPRVSDCDTDR